MVAKDVVLAQNKSLVQRSLTAVLIGATSGIGEYAARALASIYTTAGKHLRLYIVGRNQDRADAIISDLQKVCPSGDFLFVKATDLALLRDVDRVSKELISIETAKTDAGPAKIDMLILSHAGFYIGKRRETREGLDEWMSWLYYSRMRFIMQLLPLLLSSPAPAHVVSVFGPGRDQQFITNDLSLRKPENYGFISQGSHAAYMKTFFFERLASMHPGKLSLTHYYPGLVFSPAMLTIDIPWLRLFFNVFMPILKRFVMVPPDESGQRVIFHASSRYPARRSVEQDTSTSDGENLEIATSSDGIVGGGAYRTASMNDFAPLSKRYPALRKEGMSETVWNHTMKAFSDIEKGGNFTE